MTLLDTCIAIDLLRRQEVALAYVGSLAELPSLSVVSATELLAGVRNSTERSQIERLLAFHPLLDVNLEIASLAGDYLRQYRPSHGIGALDALIAATAAVHRLQLATNNLKHFPMFEGLQRPYEP